MLQQYALSRHVLLVSPTTLCGVVFSLQASARSFYRAANMEAFEKEVRSLEIKATMLCENAGEDVPYERPFTKTAGRSAGKRG